MMNENIYAKKANLLFLTVVILALFANLFVSLLSIKDLWKDKVCFDTAFNCIYMACHAACHGGKCLLTDFYKK